MITMVQLPVFTWPDLLQAAQVETWAAFLMDMRAYKGSVKMYVFKFIAPGFVLRGSGLLRL